MVSSDLFGVCVSRLYSCVVLKKSRCGLCDCRRLRRKQGFYRFFGVFNLTYTFTSLCHCVAHAIHRLNSLGEILNGTTRKRPGRFPLSRYLSQRRSGSPSARPQWLSDPVLRQVLIGQNPVLLVFCFKRSASHTAPCPADTPHCPGRQMELNIRGRCPWSMCSTSEMESGRVNVRSVLCKILYVAPPNSLHIHTVVPELHGAGGEQSSECVRDWMSWAGMFMDQDKGTCFSGGGVKKRKKKNKTFFGYDEDMPFCFLLHF